jgi:hypothetical protein
MVSESKVENLIRVLLVDVYGPLPREYVVQPIEMNNCLVRFIHDGKVA